jgi:Mg2+/Co2+ transporter CorB
MIDLLWFIVILILIVLSAFFSAAEISIFSISRVKMRRLVKQGVPGAPLLEKLKSNPERLITTILVGNTIVNIAASTLATGIAISYFGDMGIGIATGVMAFVLLTFGEILPKTVGIRMTDEFAIFSAPILKLFEALFSPIITAFMFIPRLFVKKGDPGKPMLTEKEIRSILEIGVEEKAIEAVEQQMITRLLDFRDTPVRNAMLPIEKAVKLDWELPVKRAKEVATHHGFSRYPVYSKEMDRVVGVVHTKHLDRLLKEGKGEKILREFISKDALILVSEKENLFDLFKKMQKEHIHMAVVVNSDWDQTGIISFEDLIEEIFGEIEDEEEMKRGKASKSKD